MQAIKKNITRIPDSRLVGIDMMNVASHRNHIVGLLEFDVTDVRKKLQQLRRDGAKISLNAWITHCIANSIAAFPLTGSVIVGKRKQVCSQEVNLTFIVEKMVDGKALPIPLVIKNANTKTAVEINLEIENAKCGRINSDSLTINEERSRLERLYILLPKFIRLMVWKRIIQSPNFMFNKMGNVAITSVGNVGVDSGWFIHKSIHPVSFGLGSVTKKPVVIAEQIQIREIMNVTVLIDHDNLDGAPMFRFIKHLRTLINSGKEIENQVINQ